MKLCKDAMISWGLLLLFVIVGEKKFQVSLCHSVVFMYRTKPIRDHCVWCVSRNG